KRGPERATQPVRRTQVYRIGGEEALFGSDRRAAVHDPAPVFPAAKRASSLPRTTQSCEDQRGQGSRACGSTFGAATFPCASPHAVPSFLHIPLPIRPHQRLCRGIRTTAVAQ